MVVRKVIRVRWRERGTYIVTIRRRHMLQRKLYRRKVEQKQVLQAWLVKASLPTQWYTPLLSRYYICISAMPDPCLPACLQSFVAGVKIKCRTPVFSPPQKLEI